MPEDYEVAYWTKKWGISREQLVEAVRQAGPMSAAVARHLGKEAYSHTISGFNPVQDIIEFSKTQFASFTDVQAATTATAGGALISLGTGSSLLLPGINPASLHASNFGLV